jgi:hypothetical protein
MNARDNPFSPGAGTQPPELAGREKTIENVAVALDRIRNSKSAKSTLLIGLRGVGKTVLLNRLKNNAEDEGFACAQFEAVEGRNLPAMLAPSLRSALLRMSRAQLAGHAAQTAMKALGSFISSAKLKFADMEFGFELEKEQGLADSGDLDFDLVDLMVSVGKAAKEKQTALALFIDEMQYVEQSQLAALIAALHACGQQNLPVMLVGAGLPQLVGQMGKAKSYAERLFDFPVIGALSESESRSAICRPMNALNVEIESDALDEIIAKTQGYPYFLQEWGSQVWLVSDGSPIRRNDVEMATTLAIDRLDGAFFRVRFDRCTPMEKTYLRAMAEIGIETPRSGDIATVMQKEVNQVGPIRQSLINKGMIFSPAHGDTAFTVPLFGEYMKRTMQLA